MAEPEDTLFSGLRALQESTFPKRCRNCGREYVDVGEFVAATQKVRADHDGLKQSLDDDGNSIIDLFRNCACGSTLLESFYNRRDMSADGGKRRERFDSLLAQLVAAGVDATIARAEMIKLMHGQPNDLTRLVQRAKGGAS